VRDAHEADHAARTGAGDGLVHGVAGADALEHGVRADAVGELPDPGDALLAPLLDDVGGPEPAGDLLA